MAASHLTRMVTRGLHITARRNALTKFTMPAMSPTMTEGGIASWKKKAGESFVTGDVLLEIETDKATIDVEAQDDGVMAKIIAEDGTKGVAVGSTIAILAEEGDDLAEADKMAEEASKESVQKSEAKDDKAPEAPKEESKPKKSDNNESKTKDDKPQEKKDESTGSSSKKSEKSELKDGDRIFASPIAKKIALERGIPLGQIKGSGPEGRILREDVEKWKGGSGSSSSSPSLKPGSPEVALPADYTDAPVSNMRKTIGSRLTQSKNEIPHYYLTVDIKMDKVMKLREMFNQTLAAQDKGAKLSVNDFILKAVACALADVPEANSSWLGDKIRTYHKADISVAVATPTGLITPIVTDCGGKGLAKISADTKALAKKARDGKLQPKEYQGGTFTVSNLGMYGVAHFTAIINPPQSCILAVGETQAVLVPAPEEEHGFKTEHIMKVTLSADHRTVDGAVGAQFAKAFKGYMENPLSFML